MSATFCSVAKGSLSKRELKRRYPGTYSLTVERGNWLCRYVSDSPATAEAEAWLARVKTQGNMPESWCLLSAPDNAESTQVLFIWVYDGVVMESRQCECHELDEVTLQRADLIVVTDEDYRQYLPADCEVVVEPPLTSHELATWQLKKPLPMWPFALVLGMTITAGIGMAVWDGLKPPPPPPPLPPVVQQMIDPWDAYRDELKRTPEAHHVIENAVALGAYGAFMPPGWQKGTVTFDGDALALISRRDTFGQRLVLEKWLSQYPELTESGMTIFLKEEMFSATTDRLEHLARWQGTVTTVNNMAQAIHDVLIPIRWRFEKDTPSLSPYTRQLTLEKSKVSVKELQSVGRLFSQMPVGIASLELKPTKLTMHFDVKMTLILHGIQE